MATPDYDALAAALVVQYQARSSTKKQAGLSRADDPAFSTADTTRLTAFAKDVIGAMEGSGWGIYDDTSPQAVMWACRGLDILAVRSIRLTASEIDQLFRSWMDDLSAAKLTNYNARAEGVSLVGGQCQTGPRRFGPNTFRDNLPGKPGPRGRLRNVNRGS